MVTELPGKMCNLRDGNDVVLFYLAMPFGWNGPPAHFAAFGDALTIIHRAHGMSDTDWYGPSPFRSRLYAGDGIFAEILRKIRMGACTNCWETSAKGLLGPLAKKTKQARGRGRVEATTRHPWIYFRRQRNAHQTA